MPWPLTPEPLVAFCRHFDEVMVIEEKRPIVEEQLARALVNVSAHAALSGKTAPDGSVLLPETGEITHHRLMTAIAARLAARDIALPHGPAGVGRCRHCRQSLPVPRGIVPDARIIRAPNCPMVRLWAWVSAAIRSAVF